MSITGSASTHPGNPERSDSQWDDQSAESRLKKTLPTLLRRGQRLRLLFLLWCCLPVLALSAHSQTAQQEPLPGPDSHETGQGPHGHLLGDWGGERTRLQERGVSFDFQYVSDFLSNLKSVQRERFASWNRFRGTADIDFGTLTGRQGLYFHATALWQGGGNLGTYPGLLTSPSGMSSANTCRLDLFIQPLVQVGELIDRIRSADRLISS
jgi:hypothetical protein